MIGKLKALWGLFRRGQEVANPAAWKAGQIGVTAMAALLVAALQAAAAFGVAIPADENQVTAIAGGLVALVNVVLTVVTSKRVGLPPVDPPPPGAGSGERQPEQAPY